MREIDHLMTLYTGGMKTYGSDVEALGERFREWLNTPVGSIWGNPGWGNILPEFKHAPTNQSHIQVAMENRLLTKLRSDLPEMNIRNVRITEEEIDLLKISLGVSQGTISAVISGKAGYSAGEVLTNAAGEA